MSVFSRRSLLQAGGAAAAAWLGSWALKQAQSAQADLLRPPGAGEESEFLARCIRCAQCVEACPIDVLRLADITAGKACGTPYLLAREKPCNLCQGQSRVQCQAVCPTQALHPLSQRRDVRMGQAFIDAERCLPFRGVVCKACWHACPFPQEAITFDERGRPVVIPDACVGCGLCEHACPTEPASICVQPMEQIRRQSRST